MNKQELIERIEGLKNIFGNKAEYIKIDTVIELVSELHEPEKPVVKQFVADWYEDIVDEFYVVLERLALNYKNNTDMPICKWFFETEDALTILINMHQFGYTVEKERKYTVKCKATKQYLSNDELGPHFDPNFRSNFTKSDLEKLGLGWVLECEGMEVEKVGK